MTFLFEQVFFFFFFFFFRSFSLGNSDFIFSSSAGAFLLVFFLYGLNLGCSVFFFAFDENTSTRLSDASVLSRRSQPLLADIIFVNDVSIESSLNFCTDGCSICCGL